MLNPWAVRRFISFIQKLFLFVISVVIILYVAQTPETDPHRTLKIFCAVVGCGIIWTILCLMKLAHAVKQIVQEEKDKALRKEEHD